MKKLPLNERERLIKKQREKTGEGGVSVRENFNRMIIRLEKSSITLLTTKISNEPEMTEHLKEYGLIYEEVERKRGRVTFRVTTEDYYKKITRRAEAELLIKQEKNGNSEEPSK